MRNYYLILALLYLCLPDCIPRSSPPCQAVAAITTPLPPIRRRSLPSTAASAAASVRPGRGLLGPAEPRPLPRRPLLPIGPAGGGGGGVAAAAAAAEAAAEAESSEAYREGRVAVKAAAGGRDPAGRRAGGAVGARSEAKRARRAAADPERVREVVERLV